MNERTFTSLSRRVPELRRDLQIIPVQNNGQKLLYFHDSMGYTPQNFALDESTGPLLSLISGSYSISQMAELLNHQVQKEELLGFIQLLDENRLLNSSLFWEYAEQTESAFEKKTSRKPVLAGNNYPADPSELDRFTNQLFDRHNKTNSPKNIRALYAPHIDISVSDGQYADAFSVLQSIKPKRVLILGTSHYAGANGDFYDNLPFIGSSKTFDLPGRSLKADHTILKKLKAGSPENGFTLHDRAHRIEHSIELHLLFASAIWKHDFSIVPILVAGFDELFYHESGHLAGQIERFTSELKSLIDDDTFILVSGDLSHVGKKFGDKEPAKELKKRVTAIDRQFLEIAETGEANQLLHLLKKEHDATRICGFAPLYTFLKLTEGKVTGTQIKYSWWDEHERESAVSFGSIAFTEPG